MKFKNALIVTFVAGMLATGISVGTAASITNTLDATNPGPGTTFWIPTDAQKDSAPYSRGKSQDWEWQHSAVSGTINSASLSINAYDVDKSSGELDEIYAFNNDTATWDLLGSLTGSNKTYSFTAFNFGASWFDEIALGLKIMMKIDEKDRGWRVSLANSSLSIVSEVPIPATIWLFGSGLAGLMGMRRKSKSAA